MLNPWKLTEEDRAEWAGILERAADRFRELRDAPGFERPAPACMEDLVICCQERGEVRDGATLLLVLKLFQSGEVARDQMLAMLTMIAAEVAEKPDFRARFKPGRN